MDGIDGIPEWSFVVLCFNLDPSTLQVCIRSIKRFAPQNAEIIIVDDGSATFDSDIATSVSKVIRNDSNLGIGYSRQVGITAASGHYVVFIDGDLELVRFEHEELRSTLESEARVVAVSGFYDSGDGKGWNAALDVRRVALYGKGSQGFVYDLGAYYTTFSGGLCVIRREATNGGMDLGTVGLSGEDLRLQLKLLHGGWKFSYSPCLSAIHHHQRDVFDAVKKLRSEVRGDIALNRWLASEGIMVPVLEGLSNYPMLLLIGICFSNWLLIIVALLPYFGPAIFMRRKGGAKFLIYGISYSCLRMIWEPCCLLSWRDKNLHKQLRTLVINDVFVKLKFFKSILSRYETTFSSRLNQRLPSSSCFQSQCRSESDATHIVRGSERLS